MAQKVLTNSAGIITEVTPNTTSAGAADTGKLIALNASGVLDSTIVNSKIISAGAGDSGKIPALDATGKLDLSTMPVGLGAESDVITASEALAAGDFVNIWNSSGAKVRKADASTAGKEAHGFVLSAVSSSASATVYRISQSNTQVTGLTPGAKQYLNPATPGGHTETCPTTTGQVVQVLGSAISATSMNFMPGPAITLA